MNKNGVIIIIVIIVLILIAIIGFASYSSPRTDTTYQPVQTTTPTPAIPAPISNTTVITSTTTTITPTPVTKVFTVKGSNFAFAPSTISVNKGDKVKIIFDNTGGTHDLKIEGYNVGTPTINGGQNSTFEFTADKAGTFEYYCSVGQHRQMGMKGSLIVK